MSRRGRIALKAGVWAVCLAPVARLLYEFWTDALGVNPIDHVTRTLGDWTIRLLLASLAMTPLRMRFGLSWPLTLRRLLGLFAFFYVCLHLSVWIVLDHFFDWDQLVADVWKRPYITVGMAALGLLAPLAATSTPAMVKRLGGRTWRRLHRLVYPAAILGVLHYLWLAKKGVTDPFYYAMVLALLLSVRLVEWATRLPARVVPAARPRRALVLALLLSLGLGAAVAGPARAQALRPGQPAPEITGGPWINSPPLSLAALRGRVVVVEFWTYG